MRAFISILILLNIQVILFAQQKVNFYSSDSLKITADLYLKDHKLPFILLFHQGDASRGEYNEIAMRLMKLNYNCLAVDLRSGGKINYVQNETALRAQKGNFPNTFLDTKIDIESTIKFVRKYNSRPVVLFGSSYSASLCLILARNNPDIKSVVAFSPGEYFRPGLIVKDVLTGVEKPVFISSTDLEYEYILSMVSNISDRHKTFFRSDKDQGAHGAKMLWKSSNSSDACWLQLLLFFNKIRYS